MKKLLVLLLWCSTLNAETHLVTEDVRVTASVAMHELNRIKVVNDRIAQVFGNEGAFLVETEDKSGQIFIKPNSDKPLNMTLVTESQQSIDLQLIPAERDAETIVLRLAERPEDVTESARPFADSLADLLVHISRGEDVKGFARAAVNQKPFKVGDFSVQPIETYQGRYLTGMVSEVTNVSKEPQPLTETQFFSPDIAAIALKQYTLAPHQTTQLYWVKKNG